MDTTQIPPTDDPPTYRSFYSGRMYEGSEPTVQMNPMTAFTRSSSQSKYSGVLVLGSLMTALAVMVIGAGGIGQGRSMSARASFAYKKSLQGRIISVNHQTRSFELAYTGSEDAAIQKTGRESWTIALPPGASMALKNPDRPGPCYTVPSLDGPFTPLTPVSCSDILTPDSTVLVEYMMYTASSGTVVAKSVLRSSR